MGRLIVGLTGAFGSGTTFLAENFFEKEEKFERCSLSKILKEKYVEQNNKQHENRHELQEFGNKLREGDAAILAKTLDDLEISKDREKNYVIESIRNPAEIKYFREKYPEFILIGVFADYDVRWERVKNQYGGSKDTFDKDEQKDKGNFESVYGQKISDCFFESDLILSNNVDISCDGRNTAYEDMRKKIEGYLMALRDPSNSNPTLKETLMAAAIQAADVRDAQNAKLVLLLPTNMTELLVPALMVFHADYKNVVHYWENVIEILSVMKLPRKYAKKSLMKMLTYFTTV